MGIFDRLSTLSRSNITDRISRAENPEKVLEQLIIDMRSQLAKAKQQVAAAIADEKRLSAQAEQEKKLSEDWEKRAVLAVQEGRDDLAKQALLRHNEHVQNAVQLQETWIKHREETDKLKGSLRQLNDKIEEAKRKKNILVARQKRAEAHKRIQETMSSISDKSAFETFERMAEQIEHEERKLIAAAEVNDELSGDNLMKQFQGLEVKANADEQLIALKQKMGLLPAGSAPEAKALGGGLRATLTKIQNVLAGWASQYPVLRRTQLADPSSGLVAGMVNDATDFLRGSLIGTVRGGGKLFIEGASVVVMALYLARQPNLYRDGLISLIAPRHRSIAVRVFKDMAATLRAWVVGQLIAMTVLAILTAIGLWILCAPF